MNVETREKLYEGKAKIVYATNRPGVVVQYFKDDATAFNALKRGTILGKGVVLEVLDDQVAVVGRVHDLGLALVNLLSLLHALSG